MNEQLYPCCDLETGRWYYVRVRNGVAMEAGGLPSRGIRRGQLDRKLRQVAREWRLAQSSTFGVDVTDRGAVPAQTARTARDRRSRPRVRVAAAGGGARAPGSSADDDSEHDVVAVLRGWSL